MPPAPWFCFPQAFSDQDRGRCLRITSRMHALIAVQSSPDNWHFSISTHHIPHAPDAEPQHDSQLREPRQCLEAASDSLKRAICAGKNDSGSGYHSPFPIKRQVLSQGSPRDSLKVRAHMTACAYAVARGKSSCAPEILHDADDGSAHVSGPCQILPLSPRRISSAGRCTDDGWRTHPGTSGMHGCRFRRSVPPSHSHQYAAAGQRA